MCIILLTVIYLCLFVLVSENSALRLASACAAALSATGPPVMLGAVGYAVMVDFFSWYPSNAVEDTAWR